MSQGQIMYPFPFFLLSVRDWSVKCEPNHGQHRCQNRIYVIHYGIWKKTGKAAKTVHIGHIINNSKYTSISLSWALAAYINCAQYSCYALVGLRSKQKQETHPVPQGGRETMTMTGGGVAGLHHIYIYIHTLHYITLHYVTLRYIALPYLTLHYITYTDRVRACVHTSLVHL